MMPSKTYIAMILAASMFASVHAQFSLKCTKFTSEQGGGNNFGPIGGDVIFYEFGGDYAFDGRHIDENPSQGVPRPVALAELDERYAQCLAIKKQLEEPRGMCSSDLPLTAAPYIYANFRYPMCFKDDAACAAFKKQLNAPLCGTWSWTWPFQLSVCDLNGVQMGNKHLSVYEMGYLGGGAAACAAPVTVTSTTTSVSSTTTSVTSTTTSVSTTTSSISSTTTTKACTVDGASDRDKYYDNQWKVNYYDMAKKSPCEACHDKCDVDNKDKPEKCHKDCAAKVKNCPNAAPSAAPAKSSEDQCTDMTGPYGLHCAYDKETDHCYTKELPGSNGGSGDGSGDACTSAHGDSSQSNAGAGKLLSAGSSPGSNADDTASSSAPSATTECNHEHKRDATLVAVLVLTALSLLSNIVLVLRAQTAATNADADAEHAGVRRAVGSFDVGELRKASQVSNEGRFSISNI